MDEDTFAEPWPENADSRLRQDTSDEDEWWDNEHFCKKDCEEAPEPTPKTAFTGMLWNAFSASLKSPPPHKKTKSSPFTPNPGRPPKNAKWSPLERRYVRKPDTEIPPQKPADQELHEQRERNRKGGMSPFTTPAAASWKEVLPTLYCKKMLEDEVCPRTNDRNCPGCAMCTRLFCSLCKQRDEQPKNRSHSPICLMTRSVQRGLSG